MIATGRAPLPGFEPSADSTGLLEPRADYCYGELKSGELYGQYSACFNDNGDYATKGGCTSNGGTKRCLSTNLGSAALRIECRKYRCAGGHNRKTKINKVSLPRVDKGGLMGHASHDVLASGQATLSQYVALHSSVNVVSPLTDWTYNGSWQFGQKLEIYKRNGNSTGKYGPVTSRHNGTHTHIKLDRPARLSGGPDSRLSGGEVLELTAAESVLTATGEVASASLTFSSGSSSKRGDWSQMNVQVWAKIGCQTTDRSYSEIYDWYWALLYSEEGSNVHKSQMCIALLDDQAFWGTIKMWTGNNGNNLANCECSSSDFWGVADSPCGGSALDEYW